LSRKVPNLVVRWRCEAVAAGPLGLWGFGNVTVPRAMPWAIISQPFGLN
jgi:hypothetical protein